MKLLVGLATLPRTLSLDDPRLPWIELTSEPLRLNTHPVPAALLTETPPDHASRVAAITRWLQSQSSPWDAGCRRSIADYIAALAETITHHHADLQRRLDRYDGLYAPHDYLWSAPRPLPRAWLVASDLSRTSADLAVWTGAMLLPWPPDPQPFWQDERLPKSPFRRRAI